MTSDLGALLQQDAHATLAKFDLGAPEMIGFGGETVTFALPNERVLRVLRGDPVDVDVLTLRRDFLNDIRDGLPYLLPEILEIDPAGRFTVEARLPGSPMSARLRDVRGADRRKLWRAYVDAVAETGEVALPQAADYGQLLEAAPARAPTWRGFIAGRIENAARMNADAIAGEMDDPGRLVAAGLALTEALPLTPPKRLVHGDAFPGNFMVNDDLRITALLDFGYFTVAGDPSLDLAAALLPLEMLEECEAGDFDVVQGLMAERCGEGFLASLPAYRAWFALQMADPANAGPPYPRLYDWSLENMRWLAATA